MIALALPRAEFGTRAEARTKEIERCLAMSADYILMLDSDQTMPDPTFAAFARLIHSDTAWDIAIIDAPDKYGHVASNVYYHPSGDLAYFTISCCLIKASLFARIERPWFRSDIAYQNERLDGDRLIWDVVDKFSDDNRGEDVAFSRKVLEAGLSVRVICDLKCAHYDLQTL